MKRTFLVVYDYGQGGRWAFVTADCETQITAQFPELKVVRDRPDWMSDEEQASIQHADSYDIDEPLTGLLAELARGRR